MNDNQLIKTLLLPAIVIAGLFGLYYLPDIWITEDWQLRKVDILADLKSPALQPSASPLPAPPSGGVAAPPSNSHPRVGRGGAGSSRCVPIEDYSLREDTGAVSYFEERRVSMMDRFYSKLDTLKRLKRPLRIAYYGDSFIGGDILTGYLRECFQDQYGGCGVGAVDAAMPDSRSTLLQSTDGLNFHVSTKPKDFRRESQGITCSYSIADAKASIRMTGTSANNKHVSEWTTSLLYFRPSKATTISCRINGAPAKKVYSGTSNELQVVKVSNDKIHSIEWQLDGAGSAYYLVANEDTTGICIDNFSLVAAPGMQLRHIPQQTLNEFASLRQYDLIIFQYGLNVASPKEKSYKVFRQSFDEIITNFRKAWPKAALMMVSVSDRCKGYNNGQPQAMDGIEELVKAQREIAKEQKIAFWSLYDAMGGKGSIATMQKQGEANKDFTHINYKGGKRLAIKFYDAFKDGVLNYEDSKAQKP